MKIIVICETCQQFHNYVNAALHDESKLTKRTVINHSTSVVVHIENLEFIYCNHPDRLRGQSFGGSDRIVKVGSWYNIPVEIIDEIVAYFMVRIIP